MGDRMYECVPFVDGPQKPIRDGLVQIKQYLLNLFNVYSDIIIQTYFDIDGLLRRQK